MVSAGGDRARRVRALAWLHLPTIEKMRGLGWTRAVLTCGSDLVRKSGATLPHPASPILSRNE